MVHGGERFVRPTLVDDAVIQEIEALSLYAPLHNPPAVAALRRGIEALPRSVELRLNLTRDLPAMEADPAQVQQVLMNLIVNARQAMESGGTLTIAVRSNVESGYAEISVRDTGGGIPADKLRRIFEPFFTTKSQDDRGQGGTGLGLSLARDVMESHGGRIRVESAVGTGTTFTLKFPLVPAASALVPTKTPA